MHSFKAEKANLFLCLALLAQAGCSMPASAERTPEWAGQGHYRLLVKVDPYDTDGRERDGIAFGHRSMTASNLTRRL